jgi:hypothetical protein
MIRRVDILLRQQYSLNPRRVPTAARANCGACQLAESPQQRYKAFLIARTGEDCMISITLLSVPSRPKLVLDAYCAD